MAKITDQRIDEILHNRLTWKDNKEGKAELKRVRVEIRTIQNRLERLQSVHTAMTGKPFLFV